MVSFTHVPHFLLINLVKNVVFCIDVFPPFDGVLSTHSPRYITTVKNLAAHAMLSFCLGHMYRPMKNTQIIWTNKPLKPSVVARMVTKKVITGLLAQYQVPELLSIDGHRFLFRRMLFIMSILLVGSRRRLAVSPMLRNTAINQILVGRI